MIEWKELPRGTYRHSYNGLTADVWRVGGGARWTVLNDSTGCYEANGETATLDEALEKAIAALSL